MRAHLSWDSDDTDVDLHRWDSEGDHAYWNDQEAIPSAQLSFDERYGFGPEDFEGDAGRTYSYGICYFTSNAEDGSVPETVATLDITDPDGSIRTVKRRLRHTKEAFFVGGSPDGSDDAWIPDPDWCSGEDSEYHGIQDDGGVGATGDGDGSQVTGSPSFARCDRERRRVGIVEVCADDARDEAGVTHMSGDVRLDGGVAVDAPVTVDTQQNTVYSDTDATISVVRPGGTLPVSRGPLLVETTPSRDDTSGRSQLARVSVSGGVLDALDVAGLPVHGHRVDGKLALLLDARDGGGLILNARLDLPRPLSAPTTPPTGDADAPTPTSSGTVSVGAHAAPPSAVRLLGGGVSFTEVTLPGVGWKLPSLSLNYSSADDTWSVSGGFAVKDALSLNVGGAVTHGALDALDLSVDRDVPIGTTGVILSSFGGAVSGIARPPLKVSGTVAGRWGSVPNLRDVGLINLVGATMTIDFSGRISFDGTVRLLSKDVDWFEGKLALSSSLSPFDASGRLELSANRLIFKTTMDAGIKLNAAHFTASGEATGELLGKRVARARQVVSDRGLGVSADVCIGAFGKCLDHVTVAAATRWDSFPKVDLTGVDIGDLATVASAGASRVRVERGRSLLFLQAIGSATQPSFELRSPSGRKYSTSKETGLASVVVDEATKSTFLIVPKPEAGVWSIKHVEGASTVMPQVARPIQRVRATSVRPATSRERPLARRLKRVVVRWTSKGLGSARVDVALSRSKTDPGTPIASGRPTRGSIAIKRTQFAKGANYIHLSTRSGGVATDEVVVKSPIWVR